MAQQLAHIRVDRPRFDPDTEQVRIHFDAGEDGYATLVVANAHGGWVLSLGEIRIRAGANVLIWHGHDGEGWPLAPGRYTLDLFGFGRDRRPTGAAPLQVQVELTAHTPRLGPYDDIPLRAGAWFSDAAFGADKR
jgi:hypothetical protein